MSENTIPAAATDRAAIERWEGEGGRALAVEQSSSAADLHVHTEFEIEAALLINEGGVQCAPVVFARLRRKGGRIELSERPLLNGVRVAALDPSYARQRGPDLVAFVLEDPMDVRLFRPGDIARLGSD